MLRFFDISGKRVLQKRRALPMTESLQSLQPREEPAMIIFGQSAPSLKRFIAQTALGDSARRMALKMALAFIGHAEGVAQR
ncbi:MAG: hypothetical protein N2C14_31400 [Planctomycetales bacterium]